MLWKSLGLGTCVGVGEGEGGQQVFMHAAVWSEKCVHCFCNVTAVVRVCWVVGRAHVIGGEIENRRSNFRL